MKPETLAQENARLRIALAFYADDQTRETLIYDRENDCYESVYTRDNGYRAQLALIPRSIANEYGGENHRG